MCSTKVKMDKQNENFNQGDHILVLEKEDTGADTQWMVTVERKNQMADIFGKKSRPDAFFSYQNEDVPRKKRTYGHPALMWGYFQNKP